MSKRDNDEIEAPGEIYVARWTVFFFSFSLLWFVSHSIRLAREDAREKKIRENRFMNKVLMDLRRASLKTSESNKRKEKVFIARG